MNPRSTRYLVSEFAVLCLLLFALIGIDSAYQANNLSKGSALGGVGFLMLAATVVAVGFVIDLAVKVANGTRSGI